jgi:hypothetical protein
VHSKLTTYTISYKTKFGTVSAESDNPKDLIAADQKLRDLASTIKSGPVRKTASKQRDTVSDSRRTGSGETATVLREIETKILTSNFFSSPKTTGETREKLHAVTGKYFTSRKVSQALGILREKRQLERSGKRNFYVYSLN